MVYLLSIFTISIEVSLNLSLLVLAPNIYVLTRHNCCFLPDFLNDVFKKISYNNLFTLKLNMLIVFGDGEEHYLLVVKAIG